MQDMTDNPIYYEQYLISNLCFISSFSSHAGKDSHCVYNIGIILFINRNFNIQSVKRIFLFYKKLMEF